TKTLTNSASWMRERSPAELATSRSHITKTITVSVVPIWRLPCVTAVGPGGDAVHLVKGIVAILGLPKETRQRIESQTEAVAAAVRKHLMDVRQNLIELCRRERHAGFPFELVNLISGHTGEGIV